VEEPGIDRHLWITEWEDLETQVADAPSESLGDLDDLVARMMTAHHLALEEPEGSDFADNEATREFAQARLITRQVDLGEDVDPGDVADAVNTYRELYEQLIAFGADEGSPT
jgi:hypothetical protein